MAENKRGGVFRTEQVISRIEHQRWAQLIPFANSPILGPVSNGKGGLSEKHGSKLFLLL